MTAPDLASEFGMPNGNPEQGQDRARVSTRTRAYAYARVGVSRPGRVVRLFGRIPGVDRVGRVVWGDFADSWIRTGSTPTLGAYLAAERAAPAPYGNRWLRRARLAWAYTGGVAGSVAGHVTAHLFQSPIRIAAAAAVLGGLVLIRQLGGG